jgi:hypothetical protein
MSYLALDQSKSRTGWAYWRPGLDLPVFGHFTLGDEFTPFGKVFAKLHMELSALHSTLGFESVRYEQPADTQHFDRKTSFDVPFVLMGIAAHIDSFCAAKAHPDTRPCPIRRCDWVCAGTWRRHVIGPMKRGTGRMQLKDFVEAWCREHGMKPRNDDEADAIGILDYDLFVAGITPPWRIKQATSQLAAAR